MRSGRRLTLIPSGSLVSGVFVCVCVWVSHSVMPDSLWPHGLKPASLHHPWDAPGKNTSLAVPLSRGSSNPGIEPASLKSPALAGRLFITSATWDAPSTWYRLATQQMLVNWMNGKKKINLATQWPYRKLEEHLCWKHMRVFTSREMEMYFSLHLSLSTTKIPLSLLENKQQNSEK